MRRRVACASSSLDAAERQLDACRRRARSCGARPRVAVVFATLGFGLLELDVLALEAAGHTVFYRHASTRLTRRARLQHSPAHLAWTARRASAERTRRRAERAAVGLWRRDPSVWSGDAGRPEEDRQPARLAGLAARDGRLVDRLRDVRRRASGATASPTSCCSAWAARASRPRCCARSSASRRAGRASTCSTRPIRRPCAPSPRRPSARCSFSPASRARRSSRTRWPRTSAQRSKDAGIAALGRSLRRDHRRGHGARRARARARTFRDVFINPSDIGGRYSALSFFGLVPAALMGQDVAAIVGWGARHARRRPSPAPATRLPIRPSRSGWRWAPAALAGRDKLTLIVPPALEPFGLWVEQLVAESTGQARRRRRPDRRRAAGARRSSTARSPVRRHASWRPATRTRDSGRRSRTRRSPTSSVPEPAALGAEFVRWEIATAVAGALLDINPFDEPNVQQAKDATRVLLDRYKADGRAAGRRSPMRRVGRRHADAQHAAAAALAASRPPSAPRRSLGPGDYVGAARVPRSRSPISQRRLQRFRIGVRDRTRRGDDVRVRTAVSALDRPAAQGRAEHRRLRAGDRRARRRTSPIPGEAVFVRHAGARAGARRFRRRSTRPAAARCTSICPRPTRALAVALSSCCSAAPLDPADRPSRDAPDAVVQFRRRAYAGSAGLDRGDLHAARFRRPRQDGPQHGDAARPRRPRHRRLRPRAPTPSSARQPAARTARPRSTRWSRRLTPPRAVWVMVPAGEPTESTVAALGAAALGRRRHHRRRQHELPRRRAAGGGA